MKKTYDVIIVGGGMVGLTVACALAAQTALTVAVLESAPEPAKLDLSQYHHRVSAIALSSKRIFSSIGVWETILKHRVSPFEQMDVWDAASAANIQFDSKQVAESMLGYIIENNVIQAGLEEKLSTLFNAQLIRSVKLSQCVFKEKTAELTTDSNDIFEAKLVIAADGANSWLRKQANIDITKKDYEQLGLVATVKTEIAHEKIARQVFLSSGPLAFLPLAEPNLSSIVWSVPTEEGKRLLGLSEEIFKKELSDAFEHRLGAVLECSERFSFPLYQQQASHYIGPHLALVGDAAHVVHPLAGQGVNTGLLDAASLVEVLVEAFRKGRDFSSVAALRRYERWRKADNQVMMVGIDWIKKIFANEKKSAIQLRSVGLSVTNQVSLLKNIFIRHAMG